MKATIRTERIYSITIGGVTKDGWREVSSWNGLIELECEGQKLICMTDEEDGLPYVFREVLGLDGEANLVPIKASRSLHEWMRRDEDE